MDEMEDALDVATRDWVKEYHGTLPIPKTSPTTAIPTLSQTLEPLKKLSESLFRKGFLSGLFSDFTVQVLGMTYNLHRIVLLNNPYFAGMLDGGPWKEQESRQVQIAIDDPNVTVEGVTTVLGRMYGSTELHLNSTSAPSVLAAALFFGDKELCDMTVNFIVADLSPDTVLDYLLFSDGYCYGTHSEAIVEACLTYLCREGYARKELRPVFERMPGRWLERMVTSDCFWVPSEEQRWNFIVKIIEERGRTELEKRDDEAIELAKRFEQLVSLEGTIETCTKEDAVACAAESEVDTWTKIKDQPSDDEISADDDSDSIYDNMLARGIGYIHIPFDSLLRIHNYTELHDIIDLPDLLERAAWTQKELQHMITSATEDTTEFNIDEPVVPRSDTRHIDGLRLTEVMDEDNLYLHQGMRFCPMRFGVEFSDLRRIASGEKVASSSVFYAGSMWQIYVQTVTVDETPKLGIYLQRMPVPIPKFSTYPTYAQLPATTPYIDPRKTTLTWFQLYCFFGDKCYVLESKPDKFQLTQSWGWRINKLYRDAFDAGRSLRCCVVLGHV
ncbi:hypothetical protein SpCBS45565_g04015 [Spizellomyces sp. 'palustris']|nr:hypothetical protein SpCBS45565_g04015 [Spizellomyces sp. 'palustris']